MCHLSLVQHLLDYPVIPVLDSHLSSSDCWAFNPGQPLHPIFFICNCVEMVPNVPNWLFSACAFISFVLCMIPLSWHLEGKSIIVKHRILALSDLSPAWHTGICMFMIWRGVDALNQFINSVVWNSDTINRAPVWCDICTFFSFFTSSRRSRPRSHPNYTCSLDRGPRIIPLHKPSPVPDRLHPISDTDAGREATWCHDRSRYRCRNSSFGVGSS